MEVYTFSARPLPLSTSMGVVVSIRRDLYLTTIKQRALAAPCNVTSYVAHAIFDGVVCFNLHQEAKHLSFPTAKNV